MGIKEFTCRLVEKQKESNKKAHEIMEEAKQKNELRKANYVEEKNKRDAAYKNRQIEYDEKLSKNKEEIKRILKGNQQKNFNYKPAVKKTEDSNVVCCPKCGSTSLSANKKGFSLGKALVGGLVLVPIAGVATGLIGKNKIIITCLNCGKQFKPGTK